MGASGVTLAVDIGPATTVAAIARDGRHSPIVFADSLTLPTPTVGDDPRMDLMRAVEIARGDEDAESVVAALADHLRTIAAPVGKCEAVIIIVAPSWGPRHHERVTRAAVAAGLPQPRVLSQAAAIAARAFPAAPHGQTVVVCVFGQHASHTTVVQQHDRGWIRVATQAMPDATGDRIDHALATAVGAPQTATDGVLAHIADVRTRLVAGQPTAILLPGRPGPFTVGPADLDKAAQPVRQAGLATILDTLDAAAVDAHQLYGAVVAGELSATLAPADELSERLGKQVTSVADGRLAAVYGALATRSPSPPAAAIDRRTLRRAWGLRGVHLLAPIVASIAAALLQWQIFDLASSALGSQIGRIYTDYEKLAVAFDTAAFACVGWCLTVASLAVARNLATAVRTDTTGTARDRNRQAGQIYAFAAVVGLALASMQGLLAQAIIGGPPDIVPPYLTASLAGAIVPALIAIIIGLAAPWLTATPSWTDRVHHPITAVTLAVTGILATNARSAGLSIPGLPTVVTAALGITGGALLGVGIAFTVVTARAARLILGALTGAACMIVVGFSNLHSTIVIYLIAVAVWWIRRGSRILADNLPPQWWRRLGMADDPGAKSP